MAQVCAESIRSVKHRFRSRSIRLTHYRNLDGGGRNRRGEFGPRDGL